jgi:uncharacterized PurR-regulated membrane protein YhhQ (DUF165 family)
MTARRVGAGALAAFVLSVVAANWLVARYGVVPVGFGLQAPAAVYVVGVAFTLRDVVHRTLGARWAYAAIAAGAVLSLLVSPQLAAASAVAFAASESADLGVYAALRGRGWLPAVTVSNVVGLTIDSVTFLLLAFGSLQFLAGQVVGKGWMTLAAVAVLAAVRRARGMVPA